MKAIKPLTLAIMFLLFNSLLPALQIKIGAGLTRPSDSDFRSIYGNHAAIFESQLSLNIIGPIFAWAGGEMLSRKHEIALIAESLQTTHFGISAGFGLNVLESGKARIILQAGAQQFLIREKGFREKIDLSSFGFSSGIDLHWFFSTRFFSYLACRYTRGDANHAGRTIVVGGPRLVVGIGLNI